LQRIEELAVKREIAYDTQIVRWSAVHSSYSSPDAYIPLIDLIKTKSMNLSELYGARHQRHGRDNLEQLELAKYAYSRYENLYSPAARLYGHEKQKLGIAPREAPIIPFKSNVLPNSCLTFKLIHASLCPTALKDNIFNEDFSWVTFIQEFGCVNPAFALNLSHVGYWTTLCFDDGTMWLTLIAKAILCHSTTGEERIICLKRFIQLLSFAAWKLGNRSSTKITALGKLLKLAVSSNDSRVTARLPSIEHLPSVGVHCPAQRFLIDENMIDFSSVISRETYRKLWYKASFWASEKDVRSNLNRIVWEAVKRAEVWTTETSNIIAITTERSPVKNAFLTITDSVQVLMTELEKSKMIQLAQEYYEVLFNRQQLYEFTSLLDRQNDCINRGAITGVLNCNWPCLDIPTLEVAVFKQLNNAVSSRYDYCIESSDSKLQDNNGNGQCPVLENAFRQCLIEVTSPEVSIEKFPLQLDDGFENRPIGIDIISKLTRSWDLYQRAKENIISFQPIEDIRKKLNLISKVAQHICKESWSEVVSYFEQHGDVLHRIQSAARVSTPVAPRILFPLYGRGNLPVDLQRLLETHLIYQVYAQKAQRCIMLLDTTEAVVGEEDRRHSAVRLVAEIAETHCSDGGWTPSQRPKWLLFEVENGIIIRKKQVLVANEIVAGNKQILQLNMGEGKKLHGIYLFYVRIFN